MMRSLTISMRLCRLVIESLGTGANTVPCMTSATFASFMISFGTYILLGIESRKY